MFTVLYEVLHVFLVFISILLAKVFIRPLVFFYIYIIYLQYMYIFAKPCTDERKFLSSAPSSSTSGPPASSQLLVTGKLPQNAARTAARFLFDGLCFRFSSFPLV